MAPKTRNSYGSQEPGDDIQRLTMQIEALEAGPGFVGGARPAAMNNARPNKRNSNALPTVTLPQLVIADQPPAPPRPKVRTLEEQMLRDPDAALRLSQPRVRLPKQEAPPTPEVTRKRTIISLPLIAPTQSASRAPSSTRDSFRVRIVPAEQMSTMWDDDVDDECVSDQLMQCLSCLIGLCWFSVAEDCSLGRAHSSCAAQGLRRTPTRARLSKTSRSSFEGMSNRLRMPLDPPLLQRKPGAADHGVQITKATVSARATAACPASMSPVASWSRDFWSLCRRKERVGIRSLGSYGSGCLCRSL